MGKSSVACWSGSSIPKSKAVYNSNCQRYNGNYVPLGLHRRLRLRFSLDNVDTQVDTSNGQNSLPATVMALYQREPSVEDAIDVVAVCVAPTQNKSARSLKDIPTTRQEGIKI